MKLTVAALNSDDYVGRALRPRLTHIPSGISRRIIGVVPGRTILIYMHSPGTRYNRPEPDAVKPANITLFDGRSSAKHNQL